MYVEPSRATVDGQVRSLRKPKTDDIEFGRVDPPPPPPPLCKHTSFIPAGGRPRRQIASNKQDAHWGETANTLLAHTRASARLVHVAYPIHTNRPKVQSVVYRNLQGVPCSPSSTRQHGTRRGNMTQRLPRGTDGRADSPTLIKFGSLRKPWR